PARDGEPETRPLAGTPPAVQSATVQLGVLERDRQPEPRATGPPDARRVRTPEAVEHERLLARLEPHAEVPHRDREGRLGPADAHADGLGLRVVERVGHEIAQDPLDA